MADTKKAIYIEFSKEPELYERIMEMVERNTSTAPRIAKKLISDGLSMQDDIGKIAEVVKPKIKQAARR